LKRLSLIRRNDDTAAETLAELILGILIHGIVFLLLGMIVMKHRLWFAAGLLVGILAAVYAVLNMYDTLYVGLDMSRKDSSSYIMKKSLTRAAIALALMVVSVLLDPYAFTGVVVGLLSIKTSGLFNRLLGRFLKKE
jgi:hypothetical protein